MEHSAAHGPSGDHSHGGDHLEAHGSVFKRIWVPFFILFGLTALEFLIAFTMPSGLLRTIIFLFLTVLKAFYIIAYFMHMKFERIGLVYSVGIPFLFVVYLVILLLVEGGYIYNNTYGG